MSQGLVWSCLWGAILRPRNRQAAESRLYLGPGNRTRFRGLA